MTTVGIPQALLYYQYYPMWKTFFQHLGAQVVTSPPTTRGTVTSGSARVVAETCLPVKVFCGHVISLVGKCDYVFVPSIRSIERDAYNCSKFLGLPDVVKAVVPECPPLLDPDIDISKEGKRGFYLAIYALARRFTWNPLKVKEAAEAAWQCHMRFQSQTREEGITLSCALSRMEDGMPSDEEGVNPSSATIALIGHPYVLYDEYINHRFLQRLRQLGAQVVTPEMAQIQELDRGVTRLIGKPYWTYEDEVTGAGGHYLDSQVDGVIAIIAFGCGPDSVMIDVVKRYAQRVSKPFMAITIDEHTAEAGLVTRLEAFMDMLRRRQGWEGKA
ncbi:MAG: hypothetical protein HYU86_02130 [Chloroflexi bacterium]|nr:hypothetical protein [Chloroflexota bacterium]